MEAVCSFRKVSSQINSYINLAKISNFIYYFSLKQSNESLTQTDLEILNLITNASSLHQSLSSSGSILTPSLVNVTTPRNVKKLTRTNSTTTPVNQQTNTAQFQRSISNDEDNNEENLAQNKLVGELNAELEQINCLDSTSCLVEINSIQAPFVKVFTDFLTEHEVKSKAKNNSIRFSDDCMDDHSSDIQLVQSVMYRLFAQESLYALVLSTLTKFLNELFDSTTESTMATNDFKVFKQIESLFIDLNGDLICFKFLSKHVLKFFNSPFTVKMYSQQLKKNEFDIYFNNMSSKYKYECILLSNISSFTYEIIYKLCTSYYLKTDAATEMTLNPTYDSLFQNLLDYVDKSLDTPFGIQGFCEFFAKKNYHDNEEHGKQTKLELIENSNNKFLIFFSTSSKENSSKEYFIKIITILNKLFRINFAYNHKTDSTNTFHAKLNSIIMQLNQLADLDADFLQKWLSKLVIPSEKQSTTDQLNSNFTLKQLALYLVNEKNTLVGEVVTLSILSAFIQSASKLLNIHSSVGFPDLINLMNTLSSAGSGLGHLYLFQACCIWLEYFSTLNLDKLMKKSEYQIISTDDSSEEETLIVRSACHILTYVCEVLNAIKPANIDNSSQFLSAIDSAVPKDFNKLFQKNIFADFNKDFESLIEFIKKNESKAAEQNLAKIEKKKLTKRRRFANRRGSKTLEKGLY